MILACSKLFKRLTRGGGREWNASSWVVRGNCRQPLDIVCSVRHVDSVYWSLVVRAVTVALSSASPPWTSVSRLCRRRDLDSPRVVRSLTSSTPPPPPGRTTNRRRRRRRQWQCEVERRASRVRGTRRNHCRTEHANSSPCSHRMSPSSITLIACYASHTHTHTLFSRYNPFLQNNLGPVQLP